MPWGNEIMVMSAGQLELRQNMESSCGVIVREGDIIAQRVDVCPAPVLIKSYYSNKSYVFHLGTE